MRNIFYTLLLSLFFISAVNAQDACNPYYHLKQGRKWTVTNYNAKDKYQGKQYFEVLSLSESGGKLTAKVMLKSYDKKDDLQLEKEVEFQCEDGVVYMDMGQYVPDETLEAFKDMDVTMDIDQVSFPESLEVGQQLPEGGVKMTINGPMPMTIDVRVKDRKVMAEESISSEAGTFDAFKINSITEIKMMGTREMKNVEWIAKNVGMVRSETYDKNGKLKYYSVLTDFQD